jgi:chitodextrinase
MVDPLTGTLLSGRYRLLEPLRSDEPGFAWEARDEMLGRRVAVRELTLPDDVPDPVRPGLLRQAAAMARSTGRLTHDGIITVYDVFEDRDRLWVITQLVAGRTLAEDIAAKGPWNPDRVTLLGVRLCEALAAAHVAQLVHRDVRPSNILIADGGGAMLSDLATSTAVESSRPPSAYVAPERRAGERVTVAADLYGLGATLYFAATGQAPSAAAAYPEGVLGKVIAGLTAADPATRMPLHQAHDLLSAAVRVPVETLDEASLPPPKPTTRSKGRKLVTAVVLVAVLGLAGTAYALTRSDDQPTRTPTVQPSVPTSPVGAAGTDTVAPQPPAGLKVLGRTTTAITLAWDPATDDVGIAAYRISRNGQQVGESPSPGYTDNGLTMNTAYSYTVVAVDAAGNVSQPSATASGVTLKVPDTKKPSVPTRVRVTGRSMSSIVLAWSPSVDDIGVTAYQIFRNGTQVGSVVGTRFRDSGLRSKTTYTYQIRAVDAAGNASALTARVRGTTLTTPDTMPPSVPSGFGSPGQTQTSITLTWHASSDNVGVYEYLLSRPGLAPVHVDGLTYTDKYLSEGTSYTYQLRAVDSSGNVSGVATTSATTKTTPPPPPTVIGVSVAVTPPGADCTVKATATIVVSATPVQFTVSLSANISGPSSVTFLPGDPTTKSVDFGPAPVTGNGTANVSASAPGQSPPVAGSDAWTAPNCVPGVNLSNPTATVGACPDTAINGTVKVNALNNSGPQDYTVTMAIDDTDVGSTMVTVAPNSTGMASITASGPYPDGSHTVTFSLSGAGTVSTNALVSCPTPLASPTQ